MRILASIAAAALLVGASVSFAQELPSRASPPGYGVALGNGSKVTTTFDNGLDVDDYIFEGYPGAKLKASVKRAKGSTVHAHLELVRPDGTVVTAADAGAKFKSAGQVTELSRFPVPDTTPPQFEDRPISETPLTLTSSIQFPLDQLGTWKLRVRVPDLQIELGDNATYTLAVKYGSPPKVKGAADEPNGDNQYTFNLSARGGATIKFKFKFKGADAELSSLRAPNGAFVDTAGKTKAKAGKLVSGKGIVIPDALPLGEYQLTFDATGELTNTKFIAKVSVPKTTKLKGHLDGKEPLFAVGGVSPAVGGPGTLVAVNVINAYDDNASNSDPIVMLDDIPLRDVITAPGGGFTSVRGTVPSGLPQGTFDVVVQTSRGQVAVLVNGFTRVPPPDVDSIDPLVGSSAGGFEVTITGSNFPSELADVGIQIDGSSVPVRKISASPTHVTFEAPSRAPTRVTFGVQDLRTQLFADLPINSFEYLSTPGISRITPGLVPLLGGDTVFIKGTNFRDTDTVYMETGTPGQYEVIPDAVFRDANLYSFTAPVRAKGEYEIYIEDAQAVRTTGRRTISYFQFADFTPALALAGGIGGTNAGWSTALSDFDKDGDTDLVIGLRGSGGRQSTSQVRILTNDGSGALTDETTTRIQSPASGDDWRSDRVWVKDVTQDGWDDIVIVTNDLQVPSAGQSHVRFLISEKRNSASAVNDRVFRDRTANLAATPRRGKSGVSNSDGDNWRGLDMWVGDIDQGPIGPPEIIITHKDVKEELNIFCGSYCNTSTTSFYTYSFYWGGSRTLVWDPNLRGGQGRYKYEHNFFPRKAGVTVPIFNPPPGVTIPVCNGGSCRTEFTPFTGHTLVVGDLNADRRPDVIVVNDEEVMAFGQRTSSTQVGLNRFSASTGSLVTDLTSKIMELGGESKADSAAIALLGYPDGNSLGTIVLGRAVRPVDGSHGVRLLKFKPGVTEGDLGGFEDITSLTMPPVTAADAYQASAIATVDADADGDQDLVLVANAAPSTGASALRILRNVIVGQQVGILSQTDFGGMLASVASASEPFDGESLLIGDLDGDGANEYIVTRAIPVGATNQTRAITTDK